MAIFSSLSDRLNHIFSRLTNRGCLTELEIKEAMREVRVALLEADVNYMVAKKFINEVTEKAIGESVLKSLTPGQQVIKIVNEELIKLLGGEVTKLKFSSLPPTIIMLCGLQGAGKTTMAGKLAYKLKGEGKKCLLVACDIYRPAAIEQLKVGGSKAGAEVFERGKQEPVKTSIQAIEHAKKFGFDVVIIDTAGRLQISEELMQELKDIKDKVNPSSILLTVDSMTGQEAVNVASTFNEKLDITGVIVTKLDGDTRGGAALSIKSVTGKPILYSGIGEKIGDIEPFYPDRIASRILGMGDVLSLIEKAQQAVDVEQVKRLEKAYKENSFNFEDYLMQFDNLKKMGSLQDVIGMIPGLGNKMKNVGEIDEKQLLKNKAIIQSMTIKERQNPDIINGSRKKRIAKGSGVEVSEVNQLIKQFEQMKNLMKQMRSGGIKNLMKSGFKFN